MKKDLFKLLIREFHETPLPEALPRELAVPNTRKVVTIAGPRRAGKTFFFYQYLASLAHKLPRAQCLYINFEDDRILPLEAADLQDLLEAYYELYPDMRDKETWLFLDEIQNIDGWETFVRRLHDREKVRLFVTGSSAKLFSGDIATGLRGRTLAYTLWPLGFGEYLRFNGLVPEKNLAVSSQRFKAKKLFGRYLEYGGYPEVALETDGLERAILENYFEVMLYRDIVDRYGVRNTALLKMMAKYLITNVSNEFSVNGYHRLVRNRVPVSRETVGEYLGYLEEAGIIHQVPMFSYSLKVQQRNPNKIYCTDNGLRNAVSFTFSRDIGRLAENLVYLHLRRKGMQPYYWKGAGEVDFVLKDKKNELTGINVCFTNDVPEREQAGLQELGKRFKKVRKLIILTEDLEKKSTGVEYIPLWWWLLDG